MGTSAGWQRGHRRMLSKLVIGKAHSQKKPHQPPARRVCRNKYTLWLQPSFRESFSYQKAADFYCLAAASWGGCAVPLAGHRESRRGPGAQPHPAAAEPTPRPGAACCALRVKNEKKRGKCKHEVQKSAELVPGSHRSQRLWDGQRQAGWDQEPEGG